MADDFDMAFCNEVLKPQKIFPMKKEPTDQLVNPWNDLYGVNTIKEMFGITVEEDGRNLTVHVEGTLERINPLRYTGIVKGENIIIEENGDKLMIVAPTNLENWLLTEVKMMDEPKMKTNQEFNHVVLLEHPIERGSGNIPFTLSLFYKFA